MSRPRLAIALVLALGSAALADEPFALKGGERIVFFGDSITQAGQYVAYVDAYLLTRFPEKSFTVINHGISSETISGTSEPDHAPRRPWAHERFDRDVTAWKPDVLVSCFGMNDGNYFPPDEGRFAKYREGIRRLIARTRDEAHARLTLLTPPPFDPYRRVGDPQAVHYGYKFPAIDYDRTLGLYSEFLMGLRSPEITVADVHGATNEHLSRRREERVSFSLAGDAVHPDPTGHWLMAQALLLAWHAPAEVAEARIDAGTREVEAGAVRDVAPAGEALAFTWRSPLPMPLDPAWDAQSIALERVADRLNRHRMAVRNLPAGRYRLLASVVGEGEEAEVGAVSKDDLERGLDLTALDKFPTTERARRLLARLMEHRQAAYKRWRDRIAAGQPAAEDDAPPAEIRALARPCGLRVRLEPIGDAAP